MPGLAFADYVVIAFYLLFMVALGPVFKSFSRTASDFFRGGGNMAWWVAAASMFMTGFTAWTYTGAAGKIHQAGLFFLTLTASNFIATVVTVVFTAHRFRQMRVITGNEAVRDRFGAANEQVMTWLPFPFGVVFSGIGLFTIAQFMACVFDISIPTLIITMGAVVVAMTMLGGSWAATAGDFVQMVMLVAVSIAAAVLTLAKPEIGGVSGLIDKVAEHPALYDVSHFGRPWIFIFYFVTLILNQTVLGNHLQTGAGRFVFVKNGRDARLICGITWLAAIPHTLIFMIPALACAVLFPSLAAQYPELNNPQEAAYVHMALLVLPKGLMGLLVCGIFAATLTSMNSGLSGTSAQLIRNVYLPLINPHASEARQIWLGRVMIVVMGVLYVLVGLFFATLKNLPLFELILIAAPATGIPAAIPLCMGMFIRRAPSWACWSTVLVGFTTSLLLRLALGAANIAAWFGTADAPLTTDEIGYLNIGLTTAVLIVVCVVWFLFATWVGTPWTEDAPAASSPGKKHAAPACAALAAGATLFFAVGSFPGKIEGAAGVFAALLAAATMVGPWCAGPALARLHRPGGRPAAWPAWALLGMTLAVHAAFTLPATGGTLAERTILAALGVGQPLSANEVSLVWFLAAAGLPALIVTTVRLIGLRIAGARVDRADELAKADAFIARMNTPIGATEDTAAVGRHNDDARQCMTIGTLCLVYGAFILMLLAFDNPLLGRVAIFGCAALMLSVAGVLLKRGRTLTRRRDATEPSFVGRDTVPPASPAVTPDETLHD